MDDTRSLETLLRSLRAVLLLVHRQVPNRASVEEALRFVELTLNRTISHAQRADLLRTALEHLRHANMASASQAENELLAATRRAMTAALFDTACASETQVRALAHIS
jgi:hypothetical protein